MLTKKVSLNGFTLNDFALIESSQLHVLLSASATLELELAVSHYDVMGYVAHRKNHR